MTHLWLVGIDLLLRSKHNSNISLDSRIDFWVTSGSSFFRILVNDFLHDFLKAIISLCPLSEGLTLAQGMTLQRRPTSASTRRYPRGMLGRIAFPEVEVGLQRCHRGVARQRGKLKSGRRWGVR
jgi:hypothetical protein